MKFNKYFNLSKPELFKLCESADEETKKKLLSAFDVEYTPPEIDTEEVKDKLTDVLAKDAPEEDKVEQILDKADDSWDKEDKKLELSIERIDDIVVKLTTKFQDLIYKKGREIYREMKLKSLNTIIEKYFDMMVHHYLDSDDLTFTIFFKTDVYEAFLNSLEDFIVFKDLKEFSTEK